ncbi:MAG: hypothetical protein A2745_01365 [Candidatus Harrisonbacteria bacterium RIFCSPHIGHO2_01_FULL_44_13]|uniref:Uncharacterized protein n=1 Tax=Candidatus Harrisonbacteria bacterium RIFCSPLOWO2_01_FULL_44_18 TaxID=1798407 RepID=A0A1G1ZNB7_9BACT|nr:MAG: hypothetical protein A2745_01365 [Candidatus Harrisonbacteria bacterium RIFCSPHIGHO2_01_FULL_44_13]OGY66148.1 MAG: hypothetical protein A3A16_02460 [Candidatus Harrisonbacteria bacterium RIFCSPLOWO2_01_FULL_44_18]
MDEETKNFFNELANVSKEVNKEAEAELVKAGPAVLEEQKVETEVSDDNEAAEFVDEGDGQLAIDVHQTPNEIVIESAIAGVNPEDLDISITSESVTIRGRREREKKVREEDYFYQECYWGKFSRSVILPQEIDPEKTQASIKNGVLTIRLPKLNRQKSRKLKVKFD